ncbi:molybdopterin molybdenumtransferase MoeA [Limibaculum sp. M0105]|uniref:Molybdopterin molybdenumtransferase n=1 Tax=Thermohalobaculum xanthum TaxID=2753746 RepID=A0A8J7SDJ4_9RHOB|nr:gephyrin-like molybdotransferase Glp [Thermohalobaculum xanthum]MBK0399268.1 molybdopterin molybdenumtransferase MoeA [Thermohalobaculum xanthum]
MTRKRLRDDCFALPPGVDWTPVDEALARLRAALSRVTADEEVPLASAAGRILARPVIAKRDNPPAANAAVDGYAFAWDALCGADEARLPLAEGRAAAGRPFGGTVPAGYALRILTGAEVPAGTDTVVLQEDCEVSGNEVLIAAPRKRGANTRAAGEDAVAGTEALPAGRRIAPQDLARIASVGVGRVAVCARLRVGVLSTGDELIEPGAEGAGIFDANRPMLLAFLAAQGFEAVDLGRAPDRAEEVRAALDRGADEVDAILTTGGASDGDEDHVSKLLRAEGRIETWRIAVKPGRPLALGMWRGVPIFGLPGNPVAAFVCALVFARPALMLMAGAGWVEPEGVMLPAAFEKRKKPGRREYLRARLDPEGRVEVFRSEGSGLIGGLSWATGLCELPDGALEVVPGLPVRFLPFAAFGT